MKRPAPKPRPGKRFSLALMNFSQAQLAGIGKVSITFNAAEELIDDLVRIGWRLDFDPKEILTRIGGIDGKYHLIKHAAKVWNMPREMQEALETTFGEADFRLLKKYRDGVIHARPWDAENAVGVVVERQNRRAEVLLSVEALEGLAQRLEVMWLELRELKLAYRALRDKVLDYEEPDQHKEQLAAEYQGAMARFRLHRSQRLSLPPLPEFPEPLTQEEMWEGLKSGRSDPQEPTS
jgi:hypothetical protein